MAEYNAKAWASYQEEKQKNEDWQKIGHTMLQMLRSSTEAWQFNPELRLPDIHPRDKAFSTRNLAIDDKGSSRNRGHTRSPRPITTYKKSSLQMWSRNLEDHITVTLDSLVALDPDILFINPSVLESIQDWSQANNSQSLWVQGSFEEVYPSSTSNIAGKLASIALTLKVPVLCYFCDLLNYEANDDDDDDTSPAALAVIDLVYSLIRQMIDVFPTQVTTMYDLSKSRFAKLDGSLDSFDKALHMLEKHLLLAPRTTLICIDGIEQLDGTEVESQVDAVLEVLQENMVQTLAGKKNDRRMLKILYTTAGTCDTLDNLNQEYLETVEAEDGAMRTELDLDF